ncbi:hypothetical protein [Alysiella crassa]|uniref:Uncharacterized protein n=1 Tax=Alysiella crassa TaxID=153491 RepID=A0A376BJZ4_9NEIS|nr:hypothetical protein [Alysiella crassa]UOP07676.1 hypothetical protein LVJ80_04765 [Alysiella crassa]SSY70087.1 Uncharacterised protein [Alysiella crassa]
MGIRDIRAINGNGLIFFGESDFQDDETYVSTCFISIFGFPILPVFSARILGVTGDFHNVKYQYDKVPMNWAQILRIYGYMLLYPITIFMMISAHVGTKSSNMLVVRFLGWVAVIGLPILLFLLPHLLRMRAAKAAGLDKKLTVSTSMKWIVGVSLTILSILIMLY